MSTINQVFEKVYVINLDSRTDRLITIGQKLDGLGIQYERVRAINGYSKKNLLQYEEYKKRPFNSKKAHKLEKLYKKKLLISPGAIGILKSYRKILLDAKQKKYKRILIFEDDAIFIKDFNLKFEKFYKSVEKIDWRVLALGATQHVWNFPNCIEYPSGKLEYDPTEEFYYPKVTDGAFAIGLDHRVYTDLLEEINKMNSPVDSGPLRDIYSKYHKQCIVAQPNLVVADVASSNIGEARDQFILANKLKWKMEDYNYPFQHDLVSVLMPTYNAEKTLAYSVESLINQSYPNIEIIIQDDCSTDQTGEIGKKLAKTYENVIYQKNATNVGCYATRNNALRISKGAFITVLDPDDIALEKRIESQVTALIKENALICIGRILRSKCEIEELEYKDEKKMMKLVNSRRKLNDRGFYPWEDREIIGLGTAMFRREIFVHFGLFWEERFSGDAEILERVLFHKKGMLFPINEMNIHSYLMDVDRVQDVYVQLKKVILVSPKMGEANLTNKYKGDLRKEFEKKWREKLKGEYHYEYPRFEQNEALGNANSSHVLLSEEVKNELKTSLDRSTKEIDSLKRESHVQTELIKKLEEEKEWYSRTYDHLPWWFLKVGSIFRRIKVKKGF